MGERHVMPVQRIHRRLEEVGTGSRNIAGKSEQWQNTAKRYEHVLAKLPQNQ